jgi:2-iminobutanoate/2-iminopropanoate deaminase
MLKLYNPTTMAPSAAHYSQGVEVPPGARMLYIAGQVGVSPDGAMQEGFAAQAEQAWNNVHAVLEAAGMGIEDLVHVNMYFLDEGEVATVRAIRERFLGDHKPAATFAVVSALAQPEWLYEMGAVAAKA